MSHFLFEEINSFEQQNAKALIESHNDVSSIPSIDTICQSCRYNENNRVSSSAFTRRTGEINKNMSDLRKSAQAGCWLCGLYLAAMQLWVPMDPSEVKRIVQLKVRYDVERFTIRASAFLPNIQIFTPRGEPGVFRLIADKETPVTASSEESQLFIQEKLNDCLQNHPACHTAMGSSQRVPEHWPKRILKIDAGIRGVNVRQVEFEPSMKQKYVALSYCWGGNPTEQFRAERRTISLLQEGIDVSELPKTLSDAVIASVSMGSDLIWIDSLCILQDNPKDWDEEAGKMSTVYTYSLVTIIASSAATCSEGFLDKERDKSVLLARVKNHHDQRCQIRARIIYDWGYHRGGVQSEESHRRIWADPVDRRGWTLQEKLLSTRYVSFTGGEVQWGCQTTKACECGQPMYGELDSCMRSPKDEWFAVIEEYSSRNLTEKTDVLTALAGIARKMSMSLPCWKWYAAGIWVSPELTPFTARGLLWYRGVFSSPTYFPDKYTAPSFSWASGIGEVVHFRERSDETTYPSTVIGMDVQSATSDMFGRVTPGALRMRGPLMKAQLRLENPDRTTKGLRTRLNFADGGREFSGGCKMDGPVNKVRLRPGDASDCFTVQRCRAESLEASLEMSRDFVFDSANVFLLPIQVYLRSEYTMTSFVDCLILARSAEFPGFERIGLHFMDYEPFFEKLPLQDVDIF